MLPLTSFVGCAGHAGYVSPFFNKKVEACVFSEKHHTLLLNSIFHDHALHTLHNTDSFVGVLSRTWPNTTKANHHPKA
jgi:hypothetical protein